MTIELAGSHRLVAELQTELLQLKASGSSRVELSGGAEQFTLDLSGSSRVNAYSLTAPVVSVQASGSSTVEVAPTQTLRAELSGSNIVRYVGEDITVEADTSPGSHIRQVDRAEAQAEWSEQDRR